MDWLETLEKLAPTVATAMGGPLAGAAVTALGNLFGVDSPTQDKISTILSEGKLTSEQLSKLKELELSYQNDEKERDFKYTELVYKDRDSARVSNVAGGVQGKLFYLTLILLGLTLGSEGLVLFHGYPPEIPELVVGRVLGLLDSIALTVLAYWFGASPPKQGESH
jgi:hypothetical protein